MKTAFFIDDEEIVLKGFSRVLKKYSQSFQFHFFTSPEEALKALELYKPSIVITDYLMPNMNGEQLIQRIKEKKSQTYCLLLSGEKPTLTGSWNFFMEKPVDGKELISHIEKVELN
jgi:YesN/AraC family two-component response regulator